MVHVFKHIFLVFNQQYKYFYIFFYTCISKKTKNYYLNASTVPTLNFPLKTDPQFLWSLSRDYHITFLRLKKKKKTETIKKTLGLGIYFQKNSTKIVGPLQVPTPTALFPKISLSLQSQKANITSLL